MAITIMEKRLELHRILCDILGSSEVYYQPPESIKMKYPAIVYARERIENDFANNSVYRQKVPYIITLMVRDPDSDIAVKLSKLPLCRYDRHFMANNLNHEVFTIYY